MKKMYIAVHTDVPDYMVPTLVAHSVINAHIQFDHVHGNHELDKVVIYREWLQDSFRKVVVRVGQKEFDKIAARHLCWQGHENTTMLGIPSCLVVLPMEAEDVPNVLKFANMWAPIYKENK